jgi:hypothetical protein
MINDLDIIKTSSRVQSKPLSENKTKLRYIKLSIDETKPVLLESSEVWRNNALNLNEARYTVIMLKPNLYLMELWVTATVKEDVYTS